jgi:hypothetical protein
MAKDRIQIDGVWYVKETDAVTNNQFITDIPEADITRSLARIWEDSDYAFEAKILLGNPLTDTNDVWGDCWITITEKCDDREKWVEHEVDNPRWMLGVYEGDELIMREAKKMMSSDGIAAFRGFIHLLIKQGWITKTKQK